MLRDNLRTYSPPSQNDLSVNPNHEVLMILNFVDSNISKFRPYYLAIKDSDRENRITDFLVYYFNTCLRDDEFKGYPPFDFGKNPTQANSGKETDIGVVVLTKNAKPVTIIEFEAKRFSDTSNNKEYVSGERGGIERFKLGTHASHLSICGMFGYVQSRTTTEWIAKVNEWLIELSKETNDTIDWKADEEKLEKLLDIGQIEKLQSLNTRLNLNPLRLFHYFINLL